MKEIVLILKQLVIGQIQLRMEEVANVGWPYSAESLLLQELPWHITDLQQDSGAWAGAGRRMQCLACGRGSNPCRIRKNGKWIDTSV